jgi:hypothetical protein
MMSRSPGCLGKLALILLIIVVALWAALWAGASYVAPRLIDSLLPKIAERVEKLGIGLTDLSFADIRVSPLLNRVTLTELHGRIDLTPRDDIRLQSEANIGAVEVRLQSPFTLRGSVLAEGLDVQLDPSDLPERFPYGRFTNAELLFADLPLTDPREAARTIRDRLKELFSENAVVGSGRFSGEVQIDINGMQKIVHLYTERQGERFRLRVSSTDVQDLADHVGLELAPEQVEIVSLYPLRLPVILVITIRARDLSKRHVPHDDWLRDAHRHVTWSYLLTGRFGAEFAETVTNAQEMKPGNTPDERAMDFHNNAVGRRLSAEGVTLDALPRRVRNDADIIRHPDEVASFGEERLLR